MDHKRRRRRKPLSEAQKQAARLMFEGNRIGATAAQVGVHRATLWRWNKRADFRKELDRLHAQWIRDYRRKIMREIRETPEYKRAIAARRRLPKLRKMLEEAGNSGNMREYARISAAYDKAFSNAYFRGRKPADILNSLTDISTKGKRREPMRYIVKIID